jgi:predicted HD phosphohydrolase
VLERLSPGLPCVDASSPLRRPHVARVFLPLRHHVTAHRHTADHRCSLLYVGCVQWSRLGRREKRGKEANGLDRNEWMSRALRLKAADERIGVSG